VSSGCGGGSDGPSEADLLDPSKGPLAKLFGWDVSPADQKVKQLEVEQGVADCMKDEGWEYAPQDYTSMGSNSAWMDDYNEQVADPVAYGEKYGYGIVRRDDMYEQDMDDPDSGGMYVDPNQDYMNSLSIEEQQAYQEALWGQMAQPIGEEGEYVPPPIEEQGCYGKSAASVYGTAMSDPDIQAKLSDFFERAENDPEIAAANKVWAACMAAADQSYEWASPEKIYQDLDIRLQEAKGYTVTEDDEGGWSSSGPMPDEDGNYMEPEADEAKIEQLRADEIVIWKDDYRCQGEAKILQVRREIEQRLADELLEEFPQLGEQ
jgi:hypothetical protein